MLQNETENGLEIVAWSRNTWGISEYTEKKIACDF